METIQNNKFGICHLANPVFFIAFIPDALIISTAFGAVLMFLPGIDKEYIFYSGLI